MTDENILQIFFTVTEQQKTQTRIFILHLISYEKIIAEVQKSNFLNSWSLSQEIIINLPEYMRI